MQESQMKTIEVTIDQLKAKIKLAEDLDKLHRSPAFKNVISQTYFKDKAVNLAAMFGLPQNEMQKELVSNGLIGISGLQSFFRAIYQDGEQAKLDLAEHNAELEAMLQENANG